MSKNNTIGIFDGKVSTKVVVLDGTVDLGDSQSIYVTVDGKKAVAIYVVSGDVNLRKNQNNIVDIDSQLAESMLSYVGTNDYRNYQDTLMAVDDEMCVAVYLMNGTPTTLNPQNKLVSIDGKVCVAAYSVDGCLCFPKTDLIQANTKTTSTEITDVIGKDSSRTPRRGHALEFNGTDNYILLSNSTFSSVNSFEINLDFVTSSDITSARRLVYQDLYNTGYGNYLVSILIYNSQLYIYVSNVNANMNIVANINALTKYSYKVVYNQSEFYIILNGTQTNVSSYTSGAIKSSTDSPKVGCRGLGTDQFFNGRILYYNYTIDGTTTTCDLEQEVFYDTNKLLTNTTGTTHTFNGTISSNWVIDDRKEGQYDNQLRANKYGYGTNATSGLIIPLDASDNTTPVITATTTYVGEVQRLIKKKGSAFVNNNTDNVCNTTADFPLVPPDVGWAFGAIFKHDSGHTNRMGDDSRTMIIQSSGRVDWGYPFVQGNYSLNAGDWNTIFCRLSLDGSSNKVADTWINGVFSERFVIADASASGIYRFTNACMAKRDGTYSVDKIACTYLYNGTDITDAEASAWSGNIIKDNSNELLIIFEGQGTNTSVYDVNATTPVTPYTIAGTVTSSSWTTQNEYNYCENNGFTLSGSDRIPASQSDSGKDVLGNTLSNPIVSTGYVNGGSKYQQYICPLLVNALNADNYFSGIGTDTVTALELSITDLSAISEDNIFVNTVDAGVKVGKPIWYSTNQSLAKRLMIQDCQEKDQELPDGAYWQEDTDGIIQKDTEGNWQYAI